MLTSPSADANFRRTPDDRDFDAAQQVERVAKIHRGKKRSVVAVTLGELSGHQVEFATPYEWMRGWALMQGHHPLDATYRCNKMLAGRDDAD